MQWNLEDIIIEKNIEERINKFDNLLKTLNSKISEKEFEMIILESESLGEEITKINYLPELKEATDQKDEEAKKEKSKAREVYLKYAEVGRKLDHWIKGLEVKGLERLDDVNAKRLFKVVPDLEYSLTRARTLAKHSLDLKNEEIISHKDNYGMTPMLDLREMLETEMSYEIKVKGKIIKIDTQAELTKLFYSQDGEVRKKAYKALLNKHKDNLSKFNLVYQARVRDWRYESKLRGFKTPISQRNISNDISDKTVETLLKVCQDNRKIFWQFFELKAKKMGLKKLKRWDVYAPVCAKATTGKAEKVTWEKAKKIVLDSFDNFWPDFGKKAKQIIEEKHIDLLPGKDKRSGAFCATVTPKITPYVLLNFTGTERDILVLAHELGHAVHSLMAQKHYGSTQQAGLPLAETASTLGELIVFNKMLQQETNIEVKKSLIWSKLGDAYATILRQNYFVLFEMAAFKAIEKGVTGEELSQIYFNNLKEQFGGSVDLEENFRYEWAYVSHIFETPFYCYAYNFGELLSYSLYSRYKKEGK
ncbi:MAG: M3 family oligoendopeptidase, partial [Candidatus Shapirobacteria bacterium]|nr:M3 family oligoendopeptidase [Candidatus Shapirobacteria bacterium]